MAQILKPQEKKINIIIYVNIFHFNGLKLEYDSQKYRGSQEIFTLMSKSRGSSFINSKI